MRRITILVITFLMAASSIAFGQLNKAYFNYIGAVLLNESKYESAIETLNILLRVDPEAYEAYFLRGVAKYNLDDLLGAEQDFSMAIDKNPVYTLAYRNRAITRSRLGNYDDALKDFQEAIDLRPDISGSYYSRGVTYFLSQQFGNAIEDFNQFLKYETKVADAYTNRGLCYLHLHDTVRAYEDFNAAIRTNREDPRGYYFRGTLHMAKKEYNASLLDFDRSIECDSAYVPSLFNRAIVYANTNMPVQAISDFDRVINLDSTNSLTYFNRAIIRSQIGDYNRALDDYDMVSRLSPGNVLVYYNRAGLYQQLGDLNRAVEDYDRAIDLYPDFANAYLGRSGAKYLLGDMRGSRADQTTANRKISEYRSKLNDSTFSIYADTSRQFNQLLAFDSRITGSRIAGGADEESQVNLLPMFKFTIMEPDSLPQPAGGRYRLEQLELFREEMDNRYLVLTTADSDMPTDSLVAYDRQLGEKIATGRVEWHDLFMRGITQSLIKQYTSSVNTYTEAIERNPSNAFLYINRATTRSEMIDFISSTDNSFSRITVDTDPTSRLRNSSTRVYSYDEAIADLNKAAKLLPEFAHIYYNRAILLARSSRLPEAFEDFSKAIELYPEFADAYFNRGLVQIYMKDTRKGCLDLSKAGELGMSEAYEILKQYTLLDD